MQQHEGQQHAMSLSRGSQDARLQAQRDVCTTVSQLDVLITYQELIRLVLSLVTKRVSQWKDIPLA